MSKNTSEENDITSSQQSNKDIYKFSAISLEEAQEAVNSEITNILNKFLLTPSDIKGGVVDDQV